MSTSSQYVKVWDPIVRIGHWTLVIAFFTAYFTEDEFMTQHIWAGYVVAGVVLFRIFWGIVGSTHARFSDFVYRPSTVFAYLKSLAQRKPAHYLGHNPAGGAMVVALLISLCATVYSGLALYAVEDNAGPFAGIYGQQPAVKPSASGANLSLIATVQAAEEESAAYEKAEAGDVNEQDEAFWEGLHEFFANFTLLLVAVHIVGVLLSSHFEKVNLIKSMFTGRKKLP